MGNVSVLLCMFWVLCSSCGSSQCCILPDLQFVNAGRECKRRPYERATHKTNRSIDRETQNIQGYNITLTTSQVQGAIKQSKNNKGGVVLCPCVL